MKQWRKSVSLLFTVLILTGCQGDFDTGRPPVADAGADRTVQTNGSIDINGSGNDPDGTIQSYQWKEGDTVLANTASFTYTAPGAAGVHTLTLTVTDDDNATASDEMNVTVTEPVANQSPTANAGADQNVTKGDTVALDGSDSNDTDGTIVSYLWQEGNTTLSNALMFTKSDFSIGTHTLTLTVTDDDNATGTDTVVITVHAVPNTVPTADAGADCTVQTNGSIDINGSGSDPDGTIQSYQWKEGDTILANTASFTYTAPGAAGVHTLTLTVTDDDNATASDEMNVTVTEPVANQSPTADAGADRTVQTGQSIDINGSGSDPDGTIQSYQWKEGDTVLANTASFAYTAPDTTGVHTLTLTVTDDDNATDSDEMNVTVKKERIQPLIVIRIEFNDYTFENNASVWHDKIFGMFEGQLNHYYHEISYGHFRFVEANETHGIQNDGIVTVSFDYNHPDPGSDYFEDTDVAVTKADGFVDFSQYDHNGDGHISKDELQIMFLFAGGESAYGDSPGVWAHNWCLYGDNDTPPTVDGVDVMSCSSGGNYSRFGERQGNHDATIGVMAHELGHAVFGLPDLYDTDGGSEGIGRFGLMGSGNWGYQSGEHVGETPAHMTGWSKIVSGFIAPQVVTDASNLQLRGTANSEFTLYKIPTNNDKEYFLIENRSANGYDRGLYALQGDGDYQGGLLLLHIDDNLWPDCQGQNDCNANEDHKLVDVEEANEPGLDNEADRGKYTNLFYSGNQNGFTSVTDPNSDQYDGAESGVSVTSISERGDTMTVDIEKN